MSSSYRIAHVNTTRGYRGGERQTEQLVRELAGRGFEQVVVARRNEPLARRLEGLDIEIRETSGNPLSVFAALHGVDIVHVHEGRSTYAAWLRFLVSGTPYVLTRRVQNPISDHRLAHLVYRRAAFVAAVSPAVEEIVERFEPRARSLVVVDCSSALPVDESKVEEIRQRYGGKFLVGHVGALDNAQKAQEHVIRVAASLGETHPDIQFLLVGGGPDEAMLKQLAAGLDNVDFAGFVDNVGDYLAALDVLVLPSNQEGLGSVLLDALCQRLPVVASRVGGIPLVIRDGETGLLIERGRTDQLEAAILKLKASPALMREYGDAGFELAQQYTPAAMCEKYINLYERALDRGIG